MKVVVIGCGAIVENGHRGALSGLTKSGDLHVAGIVDSSSARLEQAGAWFPQSRGFGSVAECFREIRDVDLTIVTSPPPLHASHAIEAMKAGSHVLCEKPLAGSLADGELMVAAARELGLLLTVGMTRRFYPCFVEAKRLISEGRIGKKLHFTYREGNAYNWPVATAAPFRRKTGGGGVLLDKGVHALDSLRFIFGNGHVGSNFDDAPLATVEANSLTYLTFGDSNGTMQLSWDMNLPGSLEIVGELGALWIPIGPLDILYERRESESSWVRRPALVDWPKTLDVNGTSRGRPSDYAECFHYQLVQTIRAIRFGESPAANGSDGVETLRLIDASYSIAQSLEKPWLTPEEMAHEKQGHWNSKKDSGATSSGLGNPNPVR
jgi:predicted dehydrogenase